LLLCRWCVWSSPAPFDAARRGLQPGFGPGQHSFESMTCPGQKAYAQEASASRQFCMGSVRE
jgi:hypothetical protein